MDLIRRGRSRLGKKSMMKRLGMDFKVQVVLITNKVENYRVRSSSMYKAQPQSHKGLCLTVTKGHSASLSRTHTWLSHHDRTRARVCAQQRIMTRSRTVRSPMDAT